MTAVVSSSVEDVIRKWELRQSGPTSLPSSQDPAHVPSSRWFDAPVAADAIDHSARQRRPPRRMRRLNQADDMNWNTIAPIVQEKFQLQSAELPSLGQGYTTYSCRQCKKSPNISKTNQTLDLYSLISKCQNKTNISSNYVRKEEQGIEIPSSIPSAFARWVSAQLSRHIRRFIPSLFVQRQDIEAISTLDQWHGTLFVVNRCGFIEAFLAYILLIFNSTLKVPFAFVDDELHIPAVLRFLLKKLGFVFLDKSCNEKKLAEVIHQLLSSKQTVLISQERASLIQQVFRVAEKERKFNPWIVPCSVQMETDCARWSFLDTFKAFLSPNIRNFANVSVGYPYKLKDLMASLAIHNSDSTVCSLNHLSYDTSRVAVFLPIQLLCFVLMMQWRDGVSVYRLQESLADLLLSIRDEGRFVGFSGTVDHVTRHAITVAKQQNLVACSSDATTGETVVMPRWKDRNAALRIYEHAENLLSAFAVKSALSHAVATLLGGERLLTRFIGAPVQSLAREQILDVATNLFDAISDSFVQLPACTSVESMLSEQISTFTTNELLCVKHDVYDDAEHQRLTNHLMHSSLKWDDGEDEEEWGGRDVQQIYEVNVTDDQVMFFRWTLPILRPFFSLLFNVTWLVRNAGKAVNVRYLEGELTSRFEKGLFQYGELCFERPIIGALRTLHKRHLIVIGSADHVIDLAAREPISARSNVTWNTEASEQFVTEFLTNVARCSL